MVSLKKGTFQTRAQASTVFMFMGSPRLFQPSSSSGFMKYTLSAFLPSQIFSGKRVPYNYYTEIKSINALAISGSGFRYSHHC